MEEPGLAYDVFNTWKAAQTSHERESIEGMFLIFACIEFGEYLERCIKETTQEGEQQYMSACYTIELNMKFKSPESMSDAVRSLQEYIKKDAETDYDLESYAADGIGTENIDDLMKIFLSDRKRQRITITDSGEWKNYSADFNASYGWESVLVKMFKILGVYLANGSQLDISIDNDYNGLVIRNGICKQINLKGEEEKSL